MPSRTARYALAACTVVASLSAAGVAVAQNPPGVPAGGSLPTKAARTFLTPASCAPCHNQGAGPHPRFLGEPKGPRLVKLNEFETWRVEDRHSHAYDALTGARGRQMGSLLGYKDVTTESACLSCHSTGFQKNDADPTQTGALDERDQGVGCSSCHGNYRDWVGVHGLPGEPAKTWRTLPVQEKWVSFGMVNLRDPATRAGVCYSCHIGDSDEGKVVTHAMYAAGHPPLPGIELATFQNAMPSHWWKATEVPLFVATPAAAAPYGVDLKGLADTKATVVGGMVALRESLRLIASQADVKPDAAGHAAAYPDYAQFDCYACHHDLQAPKNAKGQIEAFKNARQTRDLVGIRPDGSRIGKPGRPQPRLWSLPLARFAILQGPGGAAKLLAFDQSFAKFWAAFDAKPFGDAEAVAQEAKTLVQSIDSALPALESMSFGPDASAGLVLALSSLPATGTYDYDSARQIAWAIRSIAGEWGQKPNGPQIDAVIQRLTNDLKLDPYTTREQHAATVRDGKLVGDPLSAALIALSEGEYKTSYAAAANFNPETFKNTLNELRGLLPNAVNAAAIGGGE